MTAEDPDLGGLLSQMQQMQQQLMDAQQTRPRPQVVEGSAGGGAVHRQGHRRHGDSRT